MTVSRLLIAAFAAASVVSSALAFAQTPVRYVRYEAAGRVSWGILDNETTIRELQGSIFDGAKPTGRTVKLAEVKLLAPAEPKKVIAAGLNYKSHIGETSAAKYVGPVRQVAHVADGTRRRHHLPG